VSVATQWAGRGPGFSRAREADAESGPRPTEVGPPTGLVLRDGERRRAPANRAAGQAQHQGLVAPQASYATPNAALRVFHRPRVKSGNSTGSHPFAMDFSESATNALIVTESYTSIGV